MENFVDPAEIKEFVIKFKWSHKRISEELQKKHPGVRGLSEMSVRRFCSAHNIHKTSRLTDGQLDAVVRNVVQKVGPTYGRKMIQGKLEAENIKVQDKRISQSLGRVAPEYHKQRRQNTARLTNPRPYKADYFGHKLHLDQNEKLVMYGCTSVLAVDGYSSQILAIASMPVKNNVEIYRSVFRPIVAQHGLWDQVRVDCGKEFYLVLFIQQTLSSMRNNTLRAPYMQTPSTKNLRADRLWVEMNSRINYPIKSQLNKMVENEVIDMRNEIDKYCVSWITIHVVQAGVKEFLPAWNHHYIPGRGKPADLASRENKAVKLPETAIHSPESAHCLYERSGGKLKSFGSFGYDPLLEFPHLQAMRTEEFNSRCPSFDEVFSSVTKDNLNLLSQTVQAYIEITKRLSNTH